MSRLAGQFLRSVIPKALTDNKTHSVDGEADALIEKILRDEFKEYTVIVVAHKLESIMGFDKIALLDAGCLVEFDSPDNLLASPSAFRRLYNSSKQNQEGADRDNGGASKKIRKWSNEDNDGGVAEPTPRP